MPHCPSCDAEYDDSLNACPECGAADEVHRCERCGERYSGSDFCLACGALREPAPCATHPDRTAFGCCVVCGQALCRECRGSDQRAYRCERHRDVHMIQGWAQVYSTTRDIDAWLIRESLAAEEIDAQVYSQRDTAFSLDLGELSIVRVLVPVWDYEGAREVIRSQASRPGLAPVECPSCGELNEPDLLQCQACGATLPGDPGD